MRLFLIALIHFWGFYIAYAQEDTLHNNPWQLNLLFVGDIMGHGSQIESAAIGKNQYDYSPCFEYIAPILKQADLAIGNLELTLPGKPPYQGYPMFRTPKDLALALRYAGFDFLLTANNHSNDGGLEGVVNTISTLEEYGFYQTGTFKNKEARDAFYPLLIYKNNFRLAFLNYTYDTNGLPTRAPSMVNEIKEDQIEKDMAVARKLKPDAIIVVMHWGDEYQLQENAKQRALAQKLADWGADLIIGAHPHVVQPIKTVHTLLPDSTEKMVPIAYSLGNFISGQVKLNTDGGLMVDINMLKDSTTGVVTIAQPTYMPVWRWVQKHADGKRTYRVIPVSPYEVDASLIKMNATDHAAMLRYARATRKNLEKSQATERKITLDELNLVLSNSSN
jgi:poly-gamma-glutamate capsule biosynthesis protein CapA/YwtB (metallophosphatase superfamily)